MIELHLSLRPGEGQRAPESCAVPMLVDLVEQGFPGRGNHCPERDAGGSARRNPDTATQGENRIEHSPYRVRERAPIDCRDRVSRAMPTTEKPRPVGLDLLHADSLAVNHRQVTGPDLRISRSASAPGGHDGARFRQVFCLYEHL